MLFHRRVILLRFLGLLLALAIFGASQRSWERVRDLFATRLLSISGRWHLLFDNLWTEHITWHQNHAHCSSFGWWSLPRHDGAYPAILLFSHCRWSFQLSLDLTFEIFLLLEKFLSFLFGGLRRFLTITFLFRIFIRSVLLQLLTMCLAWLAVKLEQLLVVWF